MRLLSLKGYKLPRLESEKPVQGFYSSGYVELRVPEQFASSASPRREKILSLKKTHIESAFRIHEKVCFCRDKRILAFQSFVKFESAAWAGLVKDQVDLARTDLSY